MPREMLVKLSCGYCQTTATFDANTPETEIPGEWIVIAIPSRSKQELYCSQNCARPGLKLLCQDAALEQSNVTQMPDPASDLVDGRGAPLTSERVVESPGFDPAGA